MRKDFALALELSNRIESRAQVTAAGVSVILSAAAVAVGANDALGDRVDQSEFGWLAYVSFVALFASLCLALVIAWPRKIPLVHPDDVVEALKSPHSEIVPSYSPAAAAAITDLRHAFEERVAAQYSVIVSGMRVRGHLLQAAHIALVVGSLAAATLAANLTF